MNKWLKIVQHLLGACLPLPCHCVLCLRPSGRKIALCRECEACLPWLISPCNRCGLMMREGICVKCLRQKLPFERCQALFDYAWPVDEFIGQWKYAGELYFAKLLGTLMAERLSLRETVDCIVPLPLHPLRQRERGFNQTIELASQIADLKGLPLDRWSCTKIKSTPAQSSLGKAARMQYLQASVFAIDKSFQAKHVLVIEDVVTTGSTVGAFTMALKHAGVETVDIWAVCRTHPD
ncbi:MAG: ComF family protein [Gammaproteobacteria bacterium]|nr:ComF family protein [Gammaproteobacteria bacterium]